MAKNSEGEWHCPVTFKTFGNNTAVSAIRTSGNVYSSEAVKELNIAAKNYTDLMTGEPFTRADVIVLQDPNDPEVMKRRDINYLEFLKQVRAEAAAARAAEGSVRHTPATQAVMAEVARLRKQEEDAPSAKSNPALYSSRSTADLESTVDVDDILALHPTIEDVNPGRQVTDQRAGGSFTSTVEDVHTGNAMRLASASDIREAKWQKMRQVIAFKLKYLIFPCIDPLCVLIILICIYA
jgi:peptidyl-prolyl cis-trans isomerase-like protein 2